MKRVEKKWIAFAGSEHSERVPPEVNEGYPSIPMPNAKLSLFHTRFCRDKCRTAIAGQVRIKIQRQHRSEFAKLLENAYRAANIAFIYEWTLLAETIGVDLFSIIETIRTRKGTHDNIRFPGFGVKAKSFFKKPKPEKFLY